MPLPRLRIATLVPLLALVACAGSGSDRSPAVQTAAADDAFVENRGADCAVGPAGAIEQPHLPDPFTRADGTRIATHADWRCRRQEILRTAEAQVYGWKGPAPERVSGTIADGRIEVVVAHGGAQVRFDAALHLPEGPGPHPAMVVVAGTGGIDPALLAAEGVARIDFDPRAVGAETGGSRDRRGAFFELYGAPVQASGTLIAWAWGVSRIIDVVAQSDGRVLRADAIGVSGCSRFGKGALAAGAFDQRVALTVPIESGAAGVPVWRGGGERGSQPPHSAFGEQPWLGDGFAAFADAPQRLAIDQHAVLGLVAPRGLLVLDNPHVDWLGARLGHLGALGGAEVYRALGAGGSIGYLSDVRDGRHCAWRDEWTAAARAAIRRHLHQAPADDLPFSAAASDALRLDDYRDWTTPSL